MDFYNSAAWSLIQKTKYVKLYPHLSIKRPGQSWCHNARYCWTWSARDVRIVLRVTTESTTESYVGRSNKSTRAGHRTRDRYCSRPSCPFRWLCPGDYVSKTNNTIRSRTQAAWRCGALSLILPSLGINSRSCKSLISWSPTSNHKMEVIAEIKRRCTIEFLTINGHIQVRGSKVPELIVRTFRCIQSTLP